MGRNRIYTACITVNQVGVNNQQWHFSVPGNNRELQIKSISLLWGIINNTTGKRVPIELNTEVQLNMEVGNQTTGENISSLFDQTVGTPFTYNGNNFIITQPGQWKFDSFTVMNILNFRISLTNTNAATTFLSIISVLAEMEEKIMWQSPQVEPLKIEL